MKYWLLTTEYPPFYGGGISTYCYFTVQMMAEKGHDISVFINDSSVNDFVIEQKNNVRLIRFNPSRTNSSFFLGHVTNISFEFAHIVKYFIDKEDRPDIIEAQEYQGIAYYLLQYKCLQYGWCKSVPIVITMHSPSFLYLEYNHAPLYKYPNYWIGEMERFCLQAADLVISPSHFLLFEVQKRFQFTNPNIIIIANPYKEENKFRTRNDNEAHLEQIIFYGKLSAQKGTFKLLQYFKNLWDNGFAETLYLIGGQDIVYHPEGMEMGKLIKKQNKKFIQKGLLVLEDKIDPAKIGERLANAKVVIVPSTVENLPYVVFEMMSLGKIVLVSKQGGHSEVVQEGVNGFVFDHEQPQTFYDQLHKVLSLSNEDRKIISEKAVERIENAYCFNVIYPQKIKAFEKCLRKESSPVQKFPFISEGQNISATSKEIAYEKNLLSIVVPFYNMGDYIKETIESLKKADYPATEIIIINDGSTDRQSLEKLNTLRGFSNIKVIDVENGGLAKARNYGAEQARGQYLAFLDADDKVEPDYYSKAINVLRNCANVHYIGCWTQYFEGSHKIWPTFTPEPPIILYHNTLNSSALVYRRNSFLNYGQNDGEMSFQGLEDYESVISLLSKGYHGVVLPEILFRYRVRKNSMIRGISRVKKLVLYQYISHKHKTFYATFAADVFNLLNANGPGIHLDNPTLDYPLTGNLLNNRFSVKVIAIIKKNKHAKNLLYKIFRLINN